MLFTKPCPACDGSGLVARERCPDCRGAGRSPESQTVELDIPAGIAHGDKITVPGLGSHGRGSARPGDLQVHIEVQPDPVFTRKGDNLFCRVPISFAEAALGAKVEVPTPDGPVTLRVPPGVQSGQKLRLSGRGAPTRRAEGGRGDLFVVVQVVTPRVYDERSRELLRELERAHPVDSERVLEARPEEVSS